MKLPWTTLEKGQGFFIPALDLDATREAGLLAAVRARVLDAQALYCIHNGLIGLLFFRANPAPKRQPKSLPAADHPEDRASPETLGYYREPDAPPS